MENIETIEIADDVVLRFKTDTTLEVFGNDDVDLETPVEESFKENEEFEVTIFGVDEHKLDCQFGDGTVTFIRKKDVEIVSIN